MAFLVALVVAMPAYAGGSADPIAPVVLALAVVLAAAKVGGDLATRIGQPAVLGELVFGIVLGNLSLLGIGFFERFEHDVTLDMLARLGVVILLFEIGLESTVRDMMKVGMVSLLVAVLGVITPFFLGWGVGALLLPDRSIYVHVFLGATLTATSVGITARVLMDLSHSQAPEARVILGAAVIDDVLGLIVLAVVSALIAAADRGAAASYGAIAWVSVKGFVFLFVALALGVRVSPRMFRVAFCLRGRGVLLAASLAFCFLLAWLASVVGLAPIVGAYAAGLVLEDVHYSDFVSRGEVQLEELVRPVSQFLVPVFFVLMGMRVELSVFARPEVLLLAGAITLAAVLGKQACALGTLQSGLDRLTVGLGMIPRGEVGLIFASVGHSMILHGTRVIDDAILSAIVIMVVVTTLMTPPALRWSLGRRSGQVISR
jgi:Na+:H+ antiporter